MIGSNGFARGVPFKRARFPGTERPDQLYQEDLFGGYSGYLPWDLRSSYLHKVLESWAERVEMGDWQVDQDGIVGGIDKFKEADTGVYSLMRSFTISGISLSPGTAKGSHFGRGPRPLNAKHHGR